MKRQQSKHSWTGLLSCAILLLLLCLGSCKKDEDTTVPNLLTDFCDITTKDSIIQTFTLDDGRTFDISEKQLSINVKKDSTYRCLLTYTLDNNQPELYGLTSVISSEAKEKNAFNTFPHDPVKIISIWKAGKYINMQLGEMTNNTGSHKYNFCLDTIIGKTMHVSLIHKQPDEDNASYTQRRFASLPLHSKAATSEYDSVSLSINTFEGMRSFTYRK